VGERQDAGEDDTAECAGGDRAEAGDRRRAGNGNILACCCTDIGGSRRRDGCEGLNRNVGLLGEECRSAADDMGRRSAWDDERGRTVDRFRAVRIDGHVTAIGNHSVMPVGRKGRGRRQGDGCGCRVAMNGVIVRRQGGVVDGL
jgi:hypothetical protein